MCARHIRSTPLNSFNVPCVHYYHYSTCSDCYTAHRQSILLENSLDKTKKSHQYRVQLAIYLGEIEKNDGHRLQLNISRICSLCVVIITFLLHFDLWLFHGNDFFSLAGVNVHAFLVARVCVCEHVNKLYAFFFISL